MKITRFEDLECLPRGIIFQSDAYFVNVYYFPLWWIYSTLVNLFHWGWQQGRELTRMVYSVTRSEAFKKDLRLCSQIQATATSSMANIALRPVGGYAPEAYEILCLCNSVYLWPRLYRPNRKS